MVNANELTERKRYVLAVSSGRGKYAYASMGNGIHLFTKPNGVFMRVLKVFPDELTEVCDCDFKVGAHSSRDYGPVMRKDEFKRFKKVWRASAA